MPSFFLRCHWSCCPAPGDCWCCSRWRLMLLLAQLLVWCCCLLLVDSTVLWFAVHRGPSCCLLAHTDMLLFQARLLFCVAIGGLWYLKKYHSTGLYRLEIVKPQVGNLRGCVEMNMCKRRLRPMLREGSTTLRVVLFPRDQPGKPKTGGDHTQLAEYSYVQWWRSKSLMVGWYGFTLSKGE